MLASRVSSQIYVSLSNTLLAHFTCFELCKNGVTLDVFFCDGQIYLPIVLRFMHADACNLNSCIFIVVSIHTLFIYFPGVRLWVISHCGCYELPHACLWVRMCKSTGGFDPGRGTVGPVLGLLLSDHLPNGFHGSCANLRSHQQHEGVLFLHSHQHLISTVFKFFANLVCVKWHDIMSLIYISLVTSDIKSLFLCLLSIHVSYSMTS